MASIGPSRLRSERLATFSCVAFRGPIAGVKIGAVNLGTKAAKKTVENPFNFPCNIVAAALSNIVFHNDFDLVGSRHVCSLKSRYGHKASYIGRGRRLRRRDMKSEERHGARSTRKKFGDRA